MKSAKKTEENGEKVREMKKTKIKNKNKIK